MAGKGTYTALQKLKPITTDFGAIAKQEQSEFNKNRALEKAEKDKAEAERKSILFNPLGDESTGVETLDDALFKGIRDMNKIRYDDYTKARNNPSYAKSDEYLAKTANRANYAKNLKIFTDKYSEYAKRVTGMGGDLSGWNSDAMKEVNAFFNEEKVQFGENKYGEPIAMVAVIDPDTGEYELNEDSSQKYTETSLAKVMKGTGMYDIVPQVDTVASVKSIGDILGSDLKDVKSGWTITSKQEWANKEAGARSLVQSELGSVKNPTALAKRMWADEMGNSKADWNENAFEEVTNKMLEKVKATYDEKLKIAYNYAGENAAAGREAKINENVVTPSVTPDSNTGVPVLAPIPGLEGEKQKDGYSVSFGKGVLTDKTEGSSELIKNVWVTEDGEMFAVKLVATKTSKEATSVLGADGEIDTSKLINMSLGGGGSSSGWKVEEKTVKISETDFTNLAKNEKVKKGKNQNYKDGKELKEYLKSQFRSMPRQSAASFNSGKTDSDKTNSDEPKVGAEQFNETKSKSN